MRRQFYHAIALGALLASGCGRPVADAPAPARTIPAPPAATSSATATADAVAKGKELIEAIRAAAGGPKLTAIRAIEADGTSTMSVIAGARTLTVRAMFPEFYRQEEIPTGPGGLGFAIGLGPQRVGWIIGAQFGGANLHDPKALQDAYNRAGSQAMAGFLAGVNAPWLVDTGTFTPVLATAIDSGENGSVLVVNIEGPLGRAGRLLIDPSTHLVRRFVEPPQPGPGGEAGRNDLDFTYSDFRTVDGAQLPHAIVRRVGNVTTKWSIETYKLNPKMRPADFTQRVATKVR